MQGCLVLVRNVGVLLRGPAGSGKSITALRLIDRGHKLVADDLVRLVPTPDGAIEGRPLEETVRIEIRGLGVFEADRLYPGCAVEKCRINLVIDLDRYVPSLDAGRTVPEAGEADMLGIKIPAVRLPIPHGTDTALLVETVAGHFPGEAL